MTLLSGSDKDSDQTIGARPSGKVVISVDAMGGDKGPAAVVAGLVLSAAAHPRVDFLLHGQSALLEPLVRAAPTLSGRVSVQNAEAVVAMSDKPSQIMRHGQATSMWSTVEALRSGAAQAAVSCGNTGALMAISMLRLRKLPGVNRPAIACLWPSRNPGGFNIMLDVGADIRADAPDLLQFAAMGTSYARNGLGLARPRVGLLNVGTEDHKGRAELHEAQVQLQAAAAAGNFDYVGFVEGTDIASARVDVIVTDGFTGNIALKTGEGTAKQVAEFLRAALTSTFVAKIGAVLASAALRRLQRQIDPRQVNGGIFLGLNGTVVKSHGSADATGIAAAVGLAIRLSEAGFIDKLAARVASTDRAGQDAVPPATKQE